MPNQRSPLLKLMLVNAAIGVALGEAALGALLYTDAAGLGTAIANAAEPSVPLAMLSVMFGVTVGSAAMATSILALPAPRDAERR